MSVSTCVTCRATIELSVMEPEVTHTIDLDLEDGAGQLTLLLTISGTAGSEAVSDLASYSANPQEREEIVRRYVSKVLHVPHALTCSTAF